MAGAAAGGWAGSRLRFECASGTGVRRAGPATAPDPLDVYKGSRRKTKVFVLTCNGEAGREIPAAEFHLTPGW